jgi:2,4-dienoyl-CoA reductase (NADPH2)
MNANLRFSLDSIQQLKALGRELNVPVDAMEDVSILAQPVSVGPLSMPNSLAIHPMEGCDGDEKGRPGDLTVRRYERFLASQAGLVWAEAIAVVPQGRANPRQLWLHKDNMKSFADMLTRARRGAADRYGSDHKPVVVAQLTHSGRYSKPTGVPAPMIARHDPYRDALTPQGKPDPDMPSKLPPDCKIVTDEYLDSLQEAFVTAADMAFEVGFDAVDIKACHGYLLDELLSCHLREGKYGGSFENRTRFMLEVIDKINRNLQPGKALCTRLGIYDATPYPYGWGVDKDDYTRADLTEPKELISLLARRKVKLINITIANPYYNPHISRPSDGTIKGMYPICEHPLTGVSRHINLAGQIQMAFPDTAVIGTGYSWLRHLMPQVAAASKANGLATIIGAGRMAFAYHDFAHDIITTGKLDPHKVCISCSGCSQIMRNGGMAGCAVRDKEIYGPILRNSSTK